MSERIEGIVTKIVGSATTVACGERGEVDCDLRARLFRKRGLRLAVGDRVEVLLEDVAELGGRGVIEVIRERASVLRRTREGKRDQVLCANIDRAFIVVSVADPPYKRAFLDRVLVAIEREGLDAAIVVNKLDLLEDDESFDALEADLSVYIDLGYEVVPVSTVTGVGVEELQAAMAGRVSVFTGPSGVGKSTLLNLLAPGLGLRTGEVGKAGKGRHITTSAQLVEMPFGGYVVDTPGVRAFGIQGMAPDDLIGYFPEMEPHLGACRFGDCRHLDEPGCAIGEAVEEGEVDGERYESYVKIRLDLEDEAARQLRRPRSRR